jgi:hypothetical protein
MRHPPAPSDPDLSGATEAMLENLGPMLLPTRSLGVVALVLFVLFAAVLAGALWPLQPLDPLWQLRVSAALVNAALFPLLGLALLQLATFLDPEDPLLARRHRICSRLAVAAALGFLLMVPLHINAGLRQNRTLTTAQAARIRGAERKLGSLRQAVASAASNTELNQQLQTLQGPVLGPADLAQPLPLLKAQVRAVLQQAEQQIVRERQQAAPTSPWRLLPDLLRNAVAFLALAVGFAALAQRPGQPISLLQEWQFRRQRSLQQCLRRRAAARTEQDYLRQLIGPDDQG